MCARATCPTCDRPTYAGCGNHIEQVLGDVPAAQRCQCAGDRQKGRAPRSRRSWFGTRSTAGKR